jgi:hypothetical protein
VFLPSFDGGLRRSLLVVVIGTSETAPEEGVESVDTSRRSNEGRSNEGMPSLLWIVPLSLVDALTSSTIPSVRAIRYEVMSFRVDKLSTYMVQEDQRTNNEMPVIGIMSRNASTRNVDAILATHEPSW